MIQRNTQYANHDTQTANRNTQHGFTIIELLMTIIIAAIIVIPTSVVIYESVCKTFLPEHFTIASSLLKSETERVTNLRFNDVTNEGPTSYTGDFSDYSYQVSFYYVRADNLNIQSPNPTDYKRIQITILHTGFPDVTAVTLVSNS